MVALALAVLALVPLPGIRTPSGNISCFYVPGGSSLLCDIKQANYLTRIQKQCIDRDGLDWHGFTLTERGKGNYVCSGGILYNTNKNYPKYHTLAYGKSWKFAGYTCTSRVTGLTCNNRSLHGLFISRESWRAW